MHRIAMGVAFLLVPLAVFADENAIARRQLEKISKTYKIEIVTADPRFPVEISGGKIDGEVADEQSVDRYAILFGPEFALYPPDFVKRSHLKRVALCTKLSFSDQRRNAIPDFEHDTLYLDVERGAYDKAYLRKVIHHEFFHIVDLRDDGSLYRDDKWAALNPGPFRYGSGGKNAQSLSSESVLTNEIPGFLNHYSTTAVEEDKAEVFANLIVAPAYVELRTKKDRVLAAKVARMKELVADFCPDMDKRFWENVGRMRRAARE